MNIKNIVKIKDCYLATESRGNKFISRDGIKWYNEQHTRTAEKTERALKEYFEAWTLWSEISGLH